jgi:hypothetical protein
MKTFDVVLLVAGLGGKHAINDSFTKRKGHGMKLLME